MGKPSFKQALAFWTKLGFISFGGPAGQIAIMHEYLVTKKKWISESRFMHALNYCMLLPGPEAQQLATYIGWLLHGTRGGLAAGLLFILPSLFILLALSIAYVSFGQLPWVYALFNGLKPAVMAIILQALIKIGKKSLLSPFHLGIAILAFIGIFFFNIPFPLIILATIALAFAGRKLFPQWLGISQQASKKQQQDESAFYINNQTEVPNIGFNPARFWKQVATGILLWLLPFYLLYLLADDFAFWERLSFFFTQAALVTFGGAYAVLPYVAQVTVEKFQWLSRLQMIDGLALGETTPGPLIMVLAFVGFMAGYNYYDHALLPGTLGLLVTTYYTFLPCFLFIFIGAPIIERTKGNNHIRELLAFVTAAVVGVILNLTIYLGKAVIFPDGITWNGLDWMALGWIILSFIALQQFKVNMILWIFVSAVLGWLRWALGMA
ncbi:chromate efflux transporter [Flavihumibacter rivuli]|uniref:chromate efflux transporter n=1 Tax=Flavihumibacter rivuli TaxID=2838156 RepID=UPI001BDF6DB5|nr:chromate efflux transporter [Flavihumibacter rivuli]ULQ55914.1 chromate efflux transporter [Flavihumibacter rivuli]